MMKAVLVLLLLTILLTLATESRAQAPVTSKDLFGTWKIKDSAGGKKIGTIEFLKTGEFELTVGSARYAADTAAKWVFDAKNLKVAYEPSGGAPLVYLRGSLDKYTQSGKQASFELTLKEVNRLPVKKGTVLIFER
ncbi:MAG TPA: hypothetical protein VGZ47_17340 [Gemmataceae bacterium]|jgi:hypothetical protein|nr:hypothetical protein [Gemmataceae bacterium]